MLHSITLCFINVSPERVCEKKNNNNTCVGLQQTAWAYRDKKENERAGWQRR